MARAISSRVATLLWLGLCLHIGLILGTPIKSGRGGGGRASSSSRPQLLGGNSDLTNGTLTVSFNLTVQCGLQLILTEGPTNDTFDDDDTSPYRIVGGSEARAHIWPWQISLERFDSDDDKWAHLCGGSLITNQHVVTAAHCVARNTNAKYRVILGMHDRRSYVKTIVNVSKVTAHAQYQPVTNHADIALLRLAKPVEFDNKIQPVCLALGDATPGEKCVSTGWGHTTRGGRATDVLMQVPLPIVAMASCNGSNSYDGDIDSTMICAGETGKDTCQGDSGGPLVCERFDGSWELQGVTSWGHGCGLPNKPGIYSSVPVFIDWINKNL